MDVELLGIVQTFIGRRFDQIFEALHVHPTVVKQCHHVLCHTNDPALITLTEPSSSHVSRSHFPGLSLGITAFFP